MAGDLDQGKVDFSTYSNGDLMKKATGYSKLLKYYLEGKCLDTDISVVFTTYATGETYRYDGEADFSDPGLRLMIEQSILQRAKDLYDIACERGMGDAVRQIWGSDVVGMVINQDTEFPERAAQTHTDHGAQANIVALK